MSVLFSVLSSFEVAAQQPRDYKNKPVVVGAPSTTQLDGAISQETYQILRCNHKQMEEAFDAAIQAVNASSSVEPSDILKLIEILSTYKLFQCTSQIEAIVYLEPLIHSQVVFKQAAETLFFPKESLSKIQLQEALWAGVYLEELSFVKRALALGADINAPIYPKMTAFLLACSKTSEPVARYLFEQGAELRVVGGTNDHKTPLSAALAHGRFSQDFIDMLTNSDGGFSLEVHKRKEIAHLFSRMTPNGTSNIGSNRFLLWGYRLIPMFENYLKTAEYFYQQTDWFDQVVNKVSHQLSEETRLQLADPHIKSQLVATAEPLLESMTYALKWERQKNFLSFKDRREQFLQEAFDRLDTRAKPVLCIGLTRMSTIADTERSLHAWGMVAMRDLEGFYNVKLCNRSEEHLPGIITRKMTREELHSLWGDFQDTTDWKRDFNGELGAEFWKKTSAAFYPFRESWIKQSKQEIGNCCFYSLQSFELGTLVELFAQILSNKDDVEIFSKMTKELRTALTKKSSISGYLESSNIPGSSSQESFERDNELLASIYFRSLQHPKLTPVSEVFIGSETTFDLSLRNESLRTAWPEIRSKLCKFLSSLPSPEADPQEIRSFLEKEENRCFIEQVTVLDFSKKPLYESKKHMQIFPQELHLFKGLEKLILKENELKILPPLNFPKMSELDLSSNQLQSIPAMHLPELTVLSLENNQLRSLPNLAKDTPKLQKLNVSKNKLQTVQHTFPESLLELSLVLNSLEKVELPYLLNLTTLRLSSNPLKAVPKLLTPNLKNLYLDSIQLSDLTEGETACLNELIDLEWLNLSNNLLTQPPALHSSKLEKNINLHGNPLGEIAASSS